MERYLRERKKSVTKKASKKTGLKKPKKAVLADKKSSPIVINAKTDSALPVIADAAGNSLLNSVLVQLEKDPYFRTGYLYQAAGNLPAAASCYSQSIQQYPTAEAYTFLGHVLSLMGELDAALLQTKKAVELNPEFGLAWNDLGSYLMEKHSYEDALDCFEKALKSKSLTGKSLVYFNLAKAYTAKGHFNSAIKAVNQSITIDPNFDRALFLKGELERTLN